MRELGYIPMLNEGGQLWAVMTTASQPFPELDDEEFLAVQPFPVIETSGDELVRAPREYRTLTQHPEPILIK